MAFIDSDGNLLKCHAQTAFQLSFEAFYASGDLVTVYLRERVRLLGELNNNDLSTIDG